MRSHPRIAPSRRDRDGCGVQHRRRRHSRDHRGGALCAGRARATRSTSSTKSTCCRSSAFNALLKTLEEPPPHVKFIFATTEIRKVPVTILSRCQRFDLRRLGARRCSSSISARSRPSERRRGRTTRRCGMIARAAEGSVRDGLSLLDQAIAYGDGNGQRGRRAGDARPHRPIAQ